MLLWLGLAACGGHQVYDDPIAVDTTFDRADPSTEELARYQDAAAYSADHAGRAVMVLHGTTVLFEEGQNGHGLDEPNEIYSGTKSFSCAMALVAKQDGLLDLDAPAADTLDEWQGDSKKEAIKVSDLMHFTSGLQDDFWRLTWDGFKVRQRVQDKYAVAVAEPVIFDAGTAFHYNGTDLLVFGEVVSRKTGQDPLDYLQQRVLDPIGFHYSGWNRDPTGHPMLAYGAWTTANEWAKYGVLVRDDGQWQGQAVLPPGEFARCFEGSTAMPAYGLNFWLNAELTADQAKLVPARGMHAGRLAPDVPDDMVMAAGAHDNRLYIIPSLDLVIVRLGDGDWGWRDDEFLTRALGTR